MKKLLCVFCLSFLATVCSWSLEVRDLQCEHLTNPIGIGFSQPRLSWKLDSGHPGEVQTAYQIRAASSAAALKNGQADLWDSDKVSSDQSVLVAWAGKPLGSRSQVFWQVRAWDKDGYPSKWSDMAFFELGLLDTGTEWHGQWITADLPRYDVEQTALAKAAWINAGSTASQVAAARFALELPAGVSVRTAEMDAAADGYITIYVNGQPTHHGTTSRTAPLNADIRAELVPGKNLIAIGSATVRNASRLSPGPGRNAIAAHGSIELSDGRRITFDTDASWKCATAPDGDWFAAAFDDSAWAAATVLGPYSDTASKYSDDTIGPGRYLRKSFTVKKSIAKARLYATALGLYVASINGQRVNADSILDPGWTDYNKRVMVQTYDVTKFISPGANALGVVLSDGWYAGRVGWMGLAQYGKRPAFGAQLEITYTDGSTDVVATDDSWKAGTGPILGSDLQWGEIVDARKADPNWDKPSFNDAAWTNATVESHTTALAPQVGPPVRKLMELPPQKISRNGAGWIVDFGQNLVGHIRLATRGDAGTVITVQHAEILNTNGNLYTENLRTALAADTFILKGGGKEIFEPEFTFHGFRYVEITGYPGVLKSDDLRAVVVGSDTPRTGTFTCSDTNLNRLCENILWGQRGNFISVPTDCPQRDERMGWMGDAQVFAPTAARNADVSAFFTKWLVDVDDAQTARGDFANYSPRVQQPQPGWPVWGDAGVIIPWTMYVNYGDRAFLESNYTNMTRWVDYCAHTAKDFILTGGVGDHLAPRRTPIELVDTAYFANSTRILADSATLLGKTDDAAKYQKLHADIVTAFDSSFVSTNGELKGDTQTGYILALRFGLLPENLRPIAAQKLAENVETNGHLTTGFVGVGQICPTLTEIGRSDLAWKLVFTDTYPSWLFSVKNGATTIWERWDGWTPERGFQDSSMNSFNHYSLGSVGAWFYSGAAGIQPDEAHPGYKHFTLRPQFTPRLTDLQATLDSPYGLIESHWHVEKGSMIYEVTIPPNTSADLMLPIPPGKVLQSGKPLMYVSEKTPQDTMLPLVSGHYQFSFPRELIK